MSVGPGRDPCVTEPSSISSISSCSDAAFASAASHAALIVFNASAASDTFAGAGIDSGGGGWFYCSHHKRLVQLDPTLICPSNGNAGIGVRRCISLQNRLVWGGVLCFLSTSIGLESYCMCCEYVRLHTKSSLCFFFVCTILVILSIVLVVDSWSHPPALTPISSTRYMCMYTTACF